LDAESTGSGLLLGAAQDVGLHDHDAERDALLCDFCSFKLHDQVYLLVR
jgi:hypothetical protein